MWKSSSYIPSQKYIKIKQTLHHLILRISDQHERDITCREYNDALWYALRNVMHTISMHHKHQKSNTHIKYHPKKTSICEYNAHVPYIIYNFKMNYAIIR